MTNKEILQADLLDILFENRNKAYGAYALRKNYNHRLQWSLGISLGLVLILLTVNFGKVNGRNSIQNRQEVVLQTIDIPDKPKTPEPPRQKKLPEVAQVKSTPIKIVPNDQVKKPEVPTIDILQNGLTSTINKIGISPDSLKGAVNTAKESNNDNPGNNKEAEFNPSSSDAHFPGGKEAFAKFLMKLLITPEELEVGEKKTVLVRFMVDADGTISKTEIIQSGGDNYDREVIRVLRKMPKWIPATQNRSNVATWFTQPVTFMGVEQ